MFSPYTASLVRFSLLCAASIAFLCSTTLRAEDLTSARADYEADASDYDVVGMVVREWNETRQRNEYVIHDKRDDVRFVILSSSAVDRTELVGQRVALSGKTRLRADRAEALIHPEEVRFLSRAVQPAQFVSTDRATPPNLRPSEVLPPPVQYPTETVLPTDIHVAAPGGMVNYGPRGWLRDNFQSGRIYFGLEYLLWKSTGMKVPPLVTGNPLGTPAAEVGVIGVPSTTVLLGNGTILDGHNSGLRYSAGYWFSDRFALEAEAFHFLRQEDSFHFDSSLNLILARPFINVAPLTIAPPTFDSQIATAAWIYATSEFYGAAIRGKFNLNCDDCGDTCGNPCANGCTIRCRPKPKCGRLNLTAGYRHLRLNEQLVIQEHLIATDEFEVIDTFNTTNRFHGLEVGFDSAFHWFLFDVNLFSRLAGGVTRNQVGIAGQTTQTIAGVTTTGDVGILAQPSNIGVRTHDTASLVAEFGIDIERQITRWLRVNVGYSVLYWGNVARPGEQIDLRVHPGLFFPPIAPPGSIGALPTHRFSDYVSHGLNVGLTLVF